MGDNFPSATERVPVSIAVKAEPHPQGPEELYLDLLKRILTRVVVAQRYERHHPRPTAPFRRRVHNAVQGVLRMGGFEMVRLVWSNPEDYLEPTHEAAARPEGAETMLGTKQLDNMQTCIRNVLEQNILGDILEAGVWRGGMTIFMRGVLKAYGDRTRRVWVADSFAGLPPPNNGVESFRFWRAGDMAVSLDEVKNNFTRYALLDDQVSFLKGFFHQTLPKAPITQLAILRIDADLYQSTLDVLNSLYPKVSPGGYVIVDDYIVLTDCRKAVDTYRDTHHITENIISIDSQAVYWQKLN